MKALLVGIDPGTTVGVSVLDMKGNILDVLSSKEMGLSKLIKHIIPFGKPIVAATDKRQIPKFIEKFAAKTGCKIIAPKEDLPVSQKRDLCKAIKTRSPHQLDALASSLFAFKHLSPLLKKIHMILEKQKREGAFDGIVEQILLEEKSIDAALGTVDEKAPKDIEAVEMRLGKPDKNQKKLRSLEKENDLLRKYQKSIELRLEKMRRRPKRKKEIPNALLVYKDNRIRSLERKIRKKERAIQRQAAKTEKLVSFISGLDKDNILVKRLDNLTKDEFEKKKNLLNIKEHDVILIEDSTKRSEAVLEDLRSKGITLIARNPRRHAHMIDAKKLRLHECGHFAILERAAFEKEINRMERLYEIVEEYKRKVIDA